MAAFTAAVWLACPPLVPFFAVGYGSHLVLDVTNKQPIRLLYPLKLKASLGLCTARGGGEQGDVRCGDRCGGGAALVPHAADCRYRISSFKSTFRSLR